MRSSSARRIGGARGAEAAALLCASLIAIAACSGSSRGARPADDAARAAETPVPQSPIQPGDRPDGLPAEAFELLTKSTTDSCSACARDHRRQAFQILDDRFWPGLVLRSDSLSRFTMAPGSGNELVLAPGAGAESRLTFRFHTAADRLVGIAESDMTEESLAARLRSAPEGTLFDGAIEVVGFAYGDGAAFLYHASRNSVEIQCRVLEIAAP